MPQDPVHSSSFSSSSDSSLSNSAPEDSVANSNADATGSEELDQPLLTPVANSDAAITSPKFENSITERKAEEQIRLLSTVAAESISGIVITDLQEHILYINPAFERISGYTLEEVAGQRPSKILQGPDTDAETRRQLRAAITAETSISVEIVNYHKNGTPYWLEMHIAPVRDTAGLVTHFVAVENDITSRKNAEAEAEAGRAQILALNVQLKERLAVIEAQNAALEALATTDGLTGLKNHRALHERLLEEYDRAFRYNTPLSVLMLDVDRFKQYNDSFGHPAGDVVLRQIAQILKETARACDIVTRYGGEEFAVLLPGASSDEARTIAERLRQAVAAATWRERPMTVSIGATTLTPATPHAAALLAEADAALYRSKRRGRNFATHAGDPIDIETLSAETALLYDDFLQKLLAMQAETLSTETEQLRDTLIQAYDATIVSWGRVLDLNNKETEGHRKRVTEMMEHLARHLHMSEQEVLSARWGAWLHDIGNMAIPDGILNKEGALTEDELRIMRRHTTIAYEILQPLQFLGLAVEISYCHHEKWDGSGYPRGLKADEIPLMARLFAVIDVYDALTRDRSYGEAWPVERVKAYLQEQAGIQFDPEAVEAFLTMLKERRATRQLA